MKCSLCSEENEACFNIIDNIICIKCLFAFCEIGGFPINVKDICQKEKIQCCSICNDFNCIDNSYINNFNRARNKRK
jgi:hypothetical protein